MIDELDRISKVQPLIKDLYQYAKKNFGFDKDVTISIITDGKNAKNPLGKTAFYDPGNHKICLYVQGRHVKDIMRSLAHELVHHTQNCRGEFDSGVATVDGYAQHDDHLRAMERQAYDEGNMCFRDWEDGLKAKTKNMGLFSDTKPLGEKLMENKMNESKLRNVIRRVIKESVVKRKEAKEAQALLESLNEQEEISNQDSGDLRSKARVQTYDALMKRWGYTKK